MKFDVEGKFYMVVVKFDPVVVGSDHCRKVVAALVILQSDQNNETIHVLHREKVVQCYRH
jgi:hypothetical protein